jgi:PAS domain S-box-containing protein
MDTQEFWDDYQQIKKEVSKLRNSEARLKAIRAQYASVMRHSADLVAVIDQDGVLVEMNPAGLKLLDRSEDEIVGYPIEESFRDDDVLELGRKALEAIRSDSVLKFDWTLRPMGGPAKWITATAAPVEDESQRIVAAVVIARDMTDLLTLDEDLAQAQDLIASLRLRVKDALA